MLMLTRSMVLSCVSFFRKLALRNEHWHGGAYGRWATSRRFISHLGLRAVLLDWATERTTTKCFEILRIRSVPNSGKLSLTSTELTPQAPIMATPIFSSRGSMFTSTAWSGAHPVIALSTVKPLCFPCMPRVDSQPGIHAAPASSPLP